MLKSSLLLKSLLLSSLLGGTLTYAADTAEDRYKEMVSTSLYSIHTPSLQSGWYRFEGADKGEDPKMHNTSFVGSYSFGERGDLWRPFLIGGFGWSSIRENNGLREEVKLRSRFLKAGAGIGYYPSPKIAFSFGASLLWLRSEGTYHGSNAELKRFFDHDSDSSLSDFFATALFHGKVHGYQPYLSASLHALHMNYDHALGSSSGFAGDLELGSYTPVFGRCWNLPLRAKIFSFGSLLGGDLKHNIAFKSYGSLGASVLWKIGPKIHLFNNSFKDLELSLTLQGTAGDHALRGWKAGLGLEMAKF